MSSTADSSPTFSLHGSLGVPGSSGSSSTGFDSFSGTPVSTPSSFSSVSSWAVDNGVSSDLSGQGSSSDKQQGTGTDKSVGIRMASSGLVRERSTSPHPPAAEPSWASADRASAQQSNASQQPQRVPGPSGTPAADVERGSPPATLQRPSAYLSPKVAGTENGRPNSFYLPLDQPPPSPNGSGWPFAGGPALDRAPDTPMLRSPSQINPLFGLPPAGRAAESYQPSQREQGYFTGDMAGYKQSPPTHSLENGFPSSTPDGGAGASIPNNEKAGHPRPFFRVASNSVPQQPFVPSAPSLARTQGAGGVLFSPGSRQTPLQRRLDSSTAWLVYYFAFNLGLTIYNKRVLQGFPFPWTLTGVHTLCGAIGAQVALTNKFFTPARLTRREHATLVAFSVLYTVNIAVSNLSLHLVTVPFHQVVRATTPLFTIALSIAMYRRRYVLQTYLALLVVVAGVGFSTYGDYGWTNWGLFLTLLGTLLAALKTVVTNMMLVGRLKLNPLDLLMRMSPMAFVQCVVYSWYSGEMARVREYGATQMTQSKAIALAINGVIAFGLNVVSFTANKKTSALTMTVAANVKQVLTIVLAVWFFNLTVTPTNFFGISLTLVGGAFYAKVELDQKKAKAALAAQQQGQVPSPLASVVADGAK